jgi:hypothetical protein
MHLAGYDSRGGVGLRLSTGFARQRSCIECRRFEIFEGDGIWIITCFSGRSPGVECFRDERFVKVRNVNPKNFFAELKQRNDFLVDYLVAR